MDLNIRTSIVVLAALILAACSAPSPKIASPQVREIQGRLACDTVLSGHWLMAADVLVPKGARLVIEPGATIDVRYSESTKIDPEYLSSATELLVRGELEVRGMPGAPVVFRPVEMPDVEPVGWAGIIFDRSAGRIEGARIEAAETGVLAIGSSPLIIGNQFSSCRYGVIAQDESAPKILDNRLEGGEGGIFCWRSSSPYIKGNVIVDHDEEGIYVDRSSRPYLDRNTVRGNAIGLALFAPGLPADATASKDNGVDLLSADGKGMP